MKLFSAIADSISRHCQLTSDIQCTFHVYDMVALDSSKEDVLAFFKSTNEVYLEFWLDVNEEPKRPLNTEELENIEKCIEEVFEAKLKFANEALVKIHISLDEINNIMNKFWDPIGVASADNDDEYYSYAMQVFVMLHQDASSVEIEEFLLDMETNNMALSPNKDQAKKCVEKIMSYSANG